MSIDVGRRGVGFLGTIAELAATAQPRGVSTPMGVSRCGGGGDQNPLATGMYGDR